MADEEYVLKKSTLDQYLKLDYSHYKTNGNSSVEDLRQKYFSDVPCSLLSKLIQVYKMDLEMFEYSVDDFKKTCSKETPKEIHKNNKRKNQKKKRNKKKLKSTSKQKNK